MNAIPFQIPEIPLHCNVCPKRPTFSDVSHLLTHIASKGHLSCYYKIKVKASTDDDAKTIIDDYDDWYADYNVEELMRERMSQKEKKRGSGSNNASRRASAGSGRNTPAPAPAARHRPSQRLRDNMHLVDPALNRRFANDPIARSDTPNSMYSMDLPRNFQSHLQNSVVSHTYPFADSPLVKQESFDSDFDDEEEDPPFAPITRRAPRRRRNNNSDSMASLIEDEDLDALANDSTKLKGVYWPGMDMFDSATADMRRKRNQKKAVSVLRALQATSEIVEPTEVVYSAEGEFRVQREITGNPESEDDLIEGETEPEPDVAEKKRPRRSRPRPALTDKNVNSGRVTRNRGQPHHPSFGGRNTKKRSSYYDGLEGDDDLTFSQPPSKKRAGLSIHRDNSGPEITFNSPAQLDVLTASFRDPYQQTPPQYPRESAQSSFNDSRSHGREASWGQSGGSFRATDNGIHLPPPGYSNFGQYLHHGSGAQAGGATMANSLLPLPQHMGFGLQPVHHNNAMYSQHGNPPFDIYGLDHPDLGLLANQDMGLNASTEPPMNPLFFSSNIKDDDEATVSVAESDHEHAK